MKKKLSLFALIMAVLIVSSCEQTLEQRARKDIVSLIKKIADDPNYVEVSNVSPFINSDSIFCCTCDVEFTNYLGEKVTILGEYSLVKYREKDGSFSYYNHFTNLTTSKRERSDIWLKEYYHKEGLDTALQLYNSEQEFVIGQIYESSKFDHDMMKHKYNIKE